ncbi:MAG TPA: MaoC/PaaZ C-terminal domain-containing protein [Gammaproteobacteria bacterium]|nr:MaoC/PaaZ C-terminal domain-containing protein [Gammaproteobacteria bacterium]
MLHPDELVGRVVDARTARYRVEDTMLYALATGLGTDPLDPAQLRYVYEENLLALPSLCLVLAYPGFWLRKPEYFVDWAKVLHAEEEFVIHAPLPAAGTVTGRTTVIAIVDRGADKGAYIHSRKEVRRAEDDALLATVNTISVARGDGGLGGGGEAPRAATFALPARAPDAVCELPTLPQQALLYRLCGDFNPLHADPAVARQGGFERPILHGRCTMAVAQHALLRHCCDYDATRLKSMRVRFTAPFYPGETLRTRLWREDGRVLFDAASVERGVTVLGQGVAVVAAR